MDLDAFTWLLTDEGQALLTEAAALRASGSAELATQTTLRKRASAARVAVALSQLELRERAREKFGELAVKMYFTPDGLEQATRLSVAKHRAARLQAFVANSVIDLGCGIGGDLLASASAGLTAAGVDLDPERVAVARANLAALDLGGAVTVADATTVDHSPFDVAFADPARRTARGRTFSTEDWTPPWPWVQTLFARDSCVKVAPGIDKALIPSRDSGLRVEAEWVSDRGEVKEAALWCGHLSTVQHRATVIGDGGLATMTDEDEWSDEVRSIGRYLYEPDGAVIRAGLVGAVAARVRGWLLDPHIAYVSSAEAFHTPFASGYEILEELPYREKPLREALRARNVGSLTIKKRGVEVVPEALRKRLQLQGSEAATIVLTRTAGEGRCWSVRPL